MSTPAAAFREEGSLRSYAAFYLAMARTSIINQFQYRVAQYFYMLGMVAEPVIYIVVWTTIAEQHGGAVQGITTGEFAAYYIVWTLVRNMNVVFGAPYWEWRIREGELSGQLLKPLHPLHNDIAWFAGSKITIIVLWLPIAAGLFIAFDPTLDPTALEVVVFLFSIWGAYLLRTFLQSSMGMICFWTTRGAAFFDLFMTAELLLSGRLVPLPLMPDWVETVSWFLPFQWAFYFPIDSLVGDRSTGWLLGGLAFQLLWIGIGFAIFSLAWRRAIRHFSAVGG
jgi:ABC-2 type transport system permease protein